MFGRSSNVRRLTGSTGTESSQRYYTLRGGVGALTWFSRDRPHCLRRLNVVEADFTPFASPQAAKLDRSAASPHPTKSCDFAGTLLRLSRYRPHCLRRLNVVNDAYHARTVAGREYHCHHRLLSPRGGPPRAHSITVCRSPLLRTRNL